MADPTPFRYEGGELALFANAVNWKRYLADRVRPFLRGRVLEVGAGIGGTTRLLAGGAETSWLCLEPDPGQADEIARVLAAGDLPKHCAVQAGTLSKVPENERFDAILYIDVLEHIEDDRAELVKAAALLAPGGTLIVLSPAHQALFSAMDTAVGHFRRYSAKSLAGVAPAGLVNVKLEYLDSVGFFASLANRLVLKRSAISSSQLKVWDGYMVPVSRRLDRVLFGRFGKSVLAVWRRP